MNGKLEVSNGKLEWLVKIYFRNYQLFCLASTFNCRIAKCIHFLELSRTLNIN